MHTCWRVCESMFGILASTCGRPTFDIFTILHSLALLSLIQKVVAEITKMLIDIDLDYWLDLRISISKWLYWSQRVRSMQFYQLLELIELILAPKGRRRTTNKKKKNVYYAVGKRHARTGMGNLTVVLSSTKNSGYIKNEKFLKIFFWIHKMGSCFD